MLIDPVQGSFGVRIFSLSIVSVLIVSTFAVLAAAVFRRNSALRHTVLLSGLLGALLVPAVALVTELSGPIFELPLLHRGLSRAVIVRYEKTEHSTKQTDADSSDNGAATTTSAAAQVAIAQSGQSGPNSEMPLSRPERINPSGWSLLLYGWLAVTLVMAGFSIRSLWQAQRVRRKAIIATDFDALSIAADCAARIVGMKMKPQVLISNVVRTPAVVGIKSPAILIPGNFINSLSDDELTDVLIHEFAHVLRRDTRIVALQTFARCLYWPIPTIYLLNRHLAQAREEVCDNFVLHQCDGIRYGEILLRLAEFASGHRPLGGALGILNGQGRLELRVDRMLDDKRNSSTKTPRRTAFACATTFLLLAIFVCGTRFVAAVDEAYPKSSVPAGNAVAVAESKSGTANESPKENKRQVVTVSGTAKDIDGKPVVGAKIFLVAVNDKYELLATTLSQNDGSYEFKDVAPPGKTVEVFATADGYGLAWHGMRFFDTSIERPEGLPRGDVNDHHFYKDEPIVMNLELLKPGRLHGQVLDEKGVPVAGVKIEVHNIDYIDTEGKTYHLNFREFWGLRFVPNTIVAAKTDGMGKFELTDMPDETCVWLHVSHPNYAMQTLFAAITDREITEFRYIKVAGHTIVNGRPVVSPIYETRPVDVSPLKLTVATTRSLTVLVVDSDQNPVADIPVIATSGGQATGTSANGTTNKHGNVNLSLPPGDYQLHATGPRTTKYVTTPSEVSIAADQKSVEHTIEIQAGCTLILETVDSDTGDPVEGVNFWEEQAGPREGRRELQAHPSDVPAEKGGEKVEEPCYAVTTVKTKGVAPKDKGGAGLSEPVARDSLSGSLPKLEAKCPQLFLADNRFNA
ncbi:MAG: M56 family metallopeptidase [Planctomycetaceae bacterium]